MIMAFSNSSLKISKQSIFCRKYKQFWLLHETSHNEKFEGTDFENGNSFSQIPAKKYSNTKFSLKTQKCNFEWT